MRNKLLTADHLIARIAERQHGLITTEQLIRCGLDRAAIARRVAAGRLFPVHRGVYAVGYANLTNHARWKAATLAVSRSVLSHRSAGELWQMLERSPAIAHITIPYPASAAKWPNLTIHRSRTLGRSRTGSRFGIPVTMPSRTLADLARVATPADVRRAKRAAEKRGLPLDDDHVAEKTESDLERDFLAICRRYGVPEPECQVPIGRHRADFFWPEAGLVLEADGYIYHRGRQAMREDNDRDIELEIRGLRVMRVDDSRIEDDPAGLARDVLSLLRTPRPPTPHT